MNRFKSKFLAALVLAAPFAAGAQSPDGAAYSQVRDMAVRAYRAYNEELSLLQERDRDRRNALPTLHLATGIIRFSYKKARYAACAEPFA